jgi:hypothetical protein
MSRVAADLISRSLLCFGIAAAVAGFVRDPALSFREAELARPPAVFGVYDDFGDLIVTDVVPLRPGQEFGWRVAVDDDGLHRWREVLITPAAPREWLGADLTVSGCGRVGVTERSEVASHGFLEHAWTVTEGDPAGPHELHVYVDDRLVRIFRFTVR